MKNRENRELISVIVPIYNVEQYLEECIQSVLNQTYKNIEIILVDDGSPDNCPQICDKYKVIDSRVKVIHKKNGGLSDARNVGIEAAKGEYFIFVDSDDYIDKTMVEKLYNLLVSSNEFDIALCNFFCCNEEYQKIDLVSPIKNEIVSNFDLIDRLFENDGWFYVVAWNKLYRKKLWDNIRYPIGYIHEDEAVIHELLLSCNKIITTNEELYVYRQRVGSITNSTNNYKKITDWYLIMSKRMLLLKKIVEKDRIKKFILRNYWNNYMNDFFKLYHYDKNSLFVKKMKKSFIIILPVLISKCDFSFKYCISLLIFFINPKYYEKRFL